MATENLIIHTMPPLAPPPSGRYQYKRLPDNQSFRLLCLFPPRGNGNIECSLLIAEFPFHQAPIPYEAISYVWGDPTNKVDITCDKRSLSITVSLRDVLRRVRLADSTRFLWADGICINQEDTEEKNRQVTLMSLIYLRASQVLAWVGREDSDGNCKRAACLITKLRKDFEEYLEQKDDLYVGEVLDASDQADLEFVVRMLERPLFNRVWIIQELGVAREIVFLYGSAEIDRLDLYFFIQCMACSYDSYQLEHYTNYTGLYTSLIAFRPLLHSNEQLPDLLDLLLMGQSHGASDPRDHVFALRTHPSAGMGMIKPDYAKTVSQVFTQLSFGLIRSSKSLRLLSAVHHNESTKDEDLPSWVPALHKTNLVNPLGIDKRFFYAADSGIEIADATISHTISDEVLTVSGFVFDSIHECSSSPPSHDYEGASATEPDMSKIFKEAFTFCQFKGTYEDEKRLEAFGLTVAAGLIDSTSAEEAIIEHRANFSAFLIGEYDAEPQSDWTLPLTRNPKLLDKLRNDSINGDKNTFMRDGAVFWNHRRVLSTTQGHFGLGPQSIVEGDLCCVLFGAKVPFVLRKVDEAYVLVGECYIQGIMHGEAVETWREGGSEVAEFKLQ